MNATLIEQYDIETTWSKSEAQNIVKSSVGSDGLPEEIVSTIKRILLKNLDNSDERLEMVYDHLILLLLGDKTDKPLQAVATPLGMVAGCEEKIDALIWGVQFLKEASEVGLYFLEQRKHAEAEWFVCSKYTVDKLTRDAVENLQFLPPMKIQPFPWNNNRDGGWVHNKQHLMLGKSLGRHDEFLCYDVINTLQEIPWELDHITLAHEKQTNHTMNKRKFLRVVNEYMNNSFYFVWRYDSRGRMYSSGYDLNIQSNEYGKALLDKANKEIVPLDKLDNLYVALANHAGKDKLTWDERIAWAKGIPENEDCSSWEEPMLGRKALRAFRDTLEGNPTGYVMSLDATSSGLQIMAALSGCKETARYTNMIDPSQRYDVYSVVNDAICAQSSEFVHRKITKKAMMTHYYNSETTPKKLFSEKQLEAFYNIVDGMLPGAEDVMESVNGVWDSSATEHSWVMPDGHRVIVPVVTENHATLHEPDLGDIPFTYYSKSPSTNYRSLCPNICHSIDGYIAREMVRRCDFELAHIHDCYLFNPQYMQEVSATYKAIMIEIARSNLLEHILQDITGDTSLRYQKLSEDLCVDMKQSSYMLS